MSLEVRLNLSDAAGALEFYIVEIREGEKVAIAKPVRLEMKELIGDERYSMQEPLMRIPLHGRYSGFLKSLATELQRLDIRPADESKLIGELTATKYHLEDMRKLALKIK
jgi:hypothetical protein